MSGRSKNHTLKGGTSPYSLYMGVFPPHPPPTPYPETTNWTRHKPNTRARPKKAGKRSGTRVQTKIERNGGKKAARENILPTTHEVNAAPFVTYKYPTLKPISICALRAATKLLNELHKLRGQVAPG